MDQARKLDTYQDIDGALRALMTRLIRECPLSRQQIAEAMSLRICPECDLGPGQPVTASMLYGFTAQHGRHARFPLLFALPFCATVGNFELLAFVLGDQAERVAELARKGKALSADVRARRRHETGL